MLLQKKSDFNILLFLFLYFFIKYAFYFYVGLTTPGGKIFSSFLINYANFPYWLTITVTKISKILLELSGYEVYQISDSNITIRGSRGVTVAWGCLGVGAIGLWIAFIIAHRNFSVKNKLKWVVAGVALIFIINILRIDMIVLSNYYNWKYFRSFNAHTSFDILTYAVILVLMLVFVFAFNRRKIKPGNV